jgi:hypothetical protein
MKESFFIEGHKSKSNFEDENTLILKDNQVYSSEEEATDKARENIKSNPDIDLVVIFKRNPDTEEDEREGIKFLFRTKENEVQEVQSWWNKPAEECSESCD